MLVLELVELCTLNLQLRSDLREANQLRPGSSEIRLHR
jgi:hypothetical protein